MENKQQFILDMGILIIIVVAVYYLKLQSTGETFNPFDGVLAFIQLR